MRFNPHAFKRLTEPTPVVATDPAGTPCVPAAASGDLNQTLAAFICAYGRPTANQIPVPEGSMAVTLTLRYNDSAAQVDHFNYHAGLGCPAFIVLLVKKQAQTENLARKALTACPELHTLDWSWKSEKYGGGHGNYLISSAIDLSVAVTQSMTAKHTFSGLPVTRASWEIQFANAWRGSPLQLWPHKHYGAAVVQSAFSNGRDAGNHIAHHCRLVFERATARRGDPLHPPPRRCHACASARRSRVELHRPHQMLVRPPDPGHRRLGQSFL